MKTGHAITVCALLLGGACAGLGWWFGQPAKVVESAAPAETQPDGSIIVERRPDAKARPKHQTPKGATVERTGEFTVQGTGLKMDGVLMPCPPVTIDTTLIRNPDGSKRVIVSSPDGEITRAVDIPVETAAPPPEPPQWAAGVSYNPVKQTPGLWIERDIWRVRLGAEINQTRQVISGPTGIEARLRVGWTF
ncbi:MAG: hypothetical protein HY847_01295 [Betaproteobacteria bacterium]|nr:hypothetical protein [Betaproteobacteria bacterium]